MNRRSLISDTLQKSNVPYVFGQTVIFKTQYQITYYGEF